MGEHGSIKIPRGIYEEVVHPPPVRHDDVVDWLRGNRDPLLLGEEVDASLVAQVVEQGYASDLTDDEIEKIGRDPFLIAYAMVDVQERCVVTNERSKPNRTRANRHIPDVC